MNNILKKLSLGLIFLISQTLFSSQETVISFNEERDLELFESPNKSHTGVWKKFDCTHTKLGQNSLQEFFKNPVCDVEILKNRQNILTKLSSDTKVYHDMTQALHEFGNYEAAFTIKLAQDNEVAQNVIKSFYFENDMLTQFNSSPLALDIRHHVFKNLLPFCGPIVYHLILHMALREDDNHCAHHHHHEHHDDETNVAKMIIYALQAGDIAMHVIGIKEMIEQVQRSVTIVNSLYRQAAAAKVCLESLESVNKTVLKDPVLRQAFMGHNPISKLFDGSCSQTVKELIELLSTEYFDSAQDLSFFSSIGKTLRAHKLLHEAMPELQPALIMLGQLDAYLAVATKLHKTEHKNAQFCLVNFVENSDMPIIKMHKLWNIMLDQDHVIANDICLGDAHNPSKIIITGPNKTGKSSFIKALALNIIFAQTFGIAAADSADITVFNKVLSYITVTDDILHDKSMLVAEILRADQCLKDLKQLKKHEFAFVVIDDSLFKGTTFEKGQEAAYQFIKEIGSYNNSIACIATHLPALTKFEAGNSGFANYRIKIDLDRSGISYSTFTLERGVSSPDDVFNVIRSQDYALSWL